MSTPSARLRIALDLFDLGEQMMRARLSREYPEWTEAQVQAAIEEWLRERSWPRDGVIQARG